VEIDAHVELSRTGQWLFLLQGEAPLKQAKGAKRQCHGYWFMLEAEAIEMETAMEDVVRSLQLQQVWLLSAFAATSLPFSLTTKLPFPSLCAQRLLPLTPPPTHFPSPYNSRRLTRLRQGMPASPIKRGSSVRCPVYVCYLQKPWSVV
jgi:hypothetical protein